MKKKKNDQKKHKQEKGLKSLFFKEILPGALIGFLIGQMLFLSKRYYFDDKYIKVEKALTNQYYSKEKLINAMKEELGKAYIEEDNERKELRENFEQYMISLVLSDLNENEDENKVIYNHFYTGEFADYIGNAIFEKRELTVEEMGDVAVIHLTGFDKDSTYKELKEYKEILSGKKKVLIDLRNNSGGSTTELVSVLSAFFNENETVYTEITDDEIHKFESNKDKLVDFEKMVILVNQKTASSAEAFLYSMKTRYGDDITVVGEQTYGKNFSYNVHQFFDGAILTYVNCFMGNANGETYPSEGIAPDIVCEDSECFDLAMEILK